jgi:trehalose-6-phosphate synthase
MNPVAKEFVASRIDGDGALILSRYSGAASEFSDAILVNPFAEEEIEFAIHHALRLPAAERRRRMRRMRETVTTNNVYRWAAKIISTALRFEPAEAACQAVGESSVPQFACSSAGAQSAFGSEYPMRV